MNSSTLKSDELFWGQAYSLSDRQLPTLRTGTEIDGVLAGFDTLRRSVLYLHLLVERG